MLPYCPDAPLEPPEEKTNPLICGMLETVDRLEREIATLRDERADFNSFAHSARYLEVGLKAAIDAKYENDIFNRENELTAIKSHLAELGYAA